MNAWKLVGVVLLVLGVPSLLLGLYRAATTFNIWFDSNRLFRDPFVRSLLTEYSLPWLIVGAVMVGIGIRMLRRAPIG